MTAKSKIILEEPQSLIGLKAENIKTSFDIIKTLLTSETARFSEMKPSKTETNLYSYHLNQI